MWGIIGLLKKEDKMINLLHVSSWIWVVSALVVAVVVLRFFSHFVHIVIRFFWHGCATLVVLVAAYILLHSLHIL